MFYIPLEISSKWKWSQENLNIELLKNTKIISKTSLLRLRYMKDNAGEIVIPRKSIQPKDNVGFNITGSTELFNILMDKSFNFPKPVSLIKYLIRMHVYDNKNARVLDFFAGSGTTGHAVMELNREDGGNRTFTLVTNNENNIAHDVTYERLYRINNGRGTKEETFKWLEKNEPYKQNLNVFSIEYFDTQLFNDNVNNELIKQTLIKELQDNGITTSTKFEKHLYYDLMSLKPLDNDKEKQNDNN
ncbi:DNA methyltransferase [Mycoplasma sp. HS2188]|uniref:DNA methyltransferase n=1 Tax=Mycoplasma sp. HS2188 TaxID=2976765 RepID=UPI0021A9BAE5|nr:DNA methyltransferase [Mycoplasma sp. HS2188]MCT4470029.1 DNA methyltransferase [Mycoplasma sp. HS2188]